MFLFLIQSDAFFNSLPLLFSIKILVFGSGTLKAESNYSSALSFRPFIDL